jgi:hypothetical protein
MNPIDPSYTDLVDQIGAQHQIRIRTDANATRQPGLGLGRHVAVLLITMLAVLIVPVTPVDASPQQRPEQGSMPCPFFGDPTSLSAMCPGINLWDIDTDRDGLSNGEEILFYGTNPRSDDTDGDNLTDFGELFRFRTNPRERDTDDDGLSDYNELVHFGTNPRMQDTDGDGLRDPLEFPGNPLPPGVAYA